MDRLAYHRVLLKLSGEALGASGQGIDPHKLAEVVREVRSLRRLGVELAMVIGAGNIWRKRNQGSHMDPVTADYLGIIATVMNALALRQALQRAGVRVAVQSAVASGVPVVEPLHSARARAALKRGEVVVFAGGTGKPFCTTDTAAAERAVELRADVIVKLGPADGVYSADPAKVRRAKKLATITLRQALRYRLGFMDRAALKLCLEANMPVLVCRWQRGVLSRVLRGQQVGTLVTT